MKILMKPSVINKGEDVIKYKFDGDTMEFEYKEDKESFDFSGLPDGELDLVDEDDNPLILAHMDVGILISAEKIDGELYLELANFIDSDASEEEKHPKWIDAKDYVQSVNGEVVEEVVPDENEDIMDK